MTIKVQYLFWLLVALVAGAWPLALPTAHGTSDLATHAAVADTNARA